MFIVSNFLYALARILDMVLTLYMWLILIRALISWVSPDPYNPIVQFLVRITEPVLAPLRRWLPTWRTGIDFSPLVAILLIVFFQSFLVRSLEQLALRLQ